MKDKHWIAFLVLGLLLLGLSACTRSKNPSASSVTQPTATIGEATLPTNSDVMDQLNLLVTQTAAAAQALSASPTPVQPTSEIQAGTAETPFSTESAQVPPTSAPAASPVPTREPSPTPIPVPTRTPGIPASHTLRTGEHVYCISRRYNVDPNEVLRINGIAAGSILRAGTELTIPQTGNPFPGNRSLLSRPTNYTVKSGDTIYTIACEFGDVAPWEIAYANGLREPYNLNAGQTIRIP